MHWNFFIEIPVLFHKFFDSAGQTQLHNMIQLSFFLSRGGRWTYTILSNKRTYSILSSEPVLVFQNVMHISYTKPRIVLYISFENLVAAKYATRNFCFQTKLTIRLIVSRFVRIFYIFFCNNSPFFFVNLQN